MLVEREATHRAIALSELVDVPIMFLPLAWWHQVLSMDVSLSFSYSNLDLPNDFIYQNPEIRNW